MRSAIAGVFGTILAAAGVSLFPAPSADQVKATSPAAASPEAFELLGESPPVVGSQASPAAFELLAQADVPVSPGLAATASPPVDLSPPEPTFEPRPESRPESRHAAPEPSSPAFRSERPSAERPRPSPSDFSLLDERTRWDLVRTTERPVRILYFKGKACPPCVQIDATVIAELLRNDWLIGPSALAHLQIVTVETDTALFERYGVEQMPAFVLIRDGKEVGRKPYRTLLGTDGFGQMRYRLISAQEVADWYRAELSRTSRPGSSGNRPSGNGRSPAGSADS